MCPSDTTPDPRGMTRMPEKQRIPDPEPGGPAARGEVPDVGERPPLPERPRRMPADEIDDTAGPAEHKRSVDSDGELNRG